MSLPLLGQSKRVLFSSSYGLLHISSLPSLKDLQALENNGISSLLNVSGVNIEDIYPAKALDAFDLVQIPFADIFTMGAVVHIEAVINTLSSGPYLKLTTEEQRLALLTAVKTVVEQIKSQTPTCVFCHRGQGRSPLVVAAALQRFYHESIAQAIDRTLIIRPPALFTDISLSALQWCAEQTYS
jgi:hypothetical protein